MSTSKHHRDFFNSQDCATVSTATILGCRNESLLVFWSWLDLESGASQAEETNMTHEEPHKFCQRIPNMPQGSSRCIWVHLRDRTHRKHTRDWHRSREPVKTSKRWCKSVAIVLGCLRSKHVKAMDPRHGPMMTHGISHLRVRNYHELRSHETGPPRKSTDLV